MSQDIPQRRSGEMNHQAHQAPYWPTIYAGEFAPRPHIGDDNGLRRRKGEPMERLQEIMPKPTTKPDPSPEATVEEVAQHIRAWRSEQGGWLPGSTADAIADHIAAKFEIRGRT